MRMFFSGCVLFARTLILTASEAILFVAGAKVALIALGVVYLIANKV